MWQRRGIYIYPKNGSIHSPYHKPWQDAANAGLPRTRICSETWGDMVRLQEAGVYPAAFAAFAAPVIMLYGAADPHPGEMIKASLEPYLPQLEYQEWESCGHYPWLEKAVRNEFFESQPAIHTQFQR